MYKVHLKTDHFVMSGSFKKDKLLTKKLTSDVEGAEPQVK